MNYKDITEEYYTKWVGCDISICPSGVVTYVYTKDRNNTQIGYSQPFDIYLLYKKDKVIVSYGDKAKDKLPLLKNILKANMTIVQIKNLLKIVFHMAPDHSIKFAFEDSPHQVTNARTLNKEDYAYFENFFKKNNSNAKCIDWLEEYYMELVERNLCCGIFEDNVLVSCTDAPSMPYIKEKIQEIGINTLNDYKGMGYATNCCIKCTQNILAQEKCPQWSTTIDNIPSQRLAYKVGFIKYADVLTLSF